jgi:hypothetical protein
VNDLQTGLRLEIVWVTLLLRVLLLLRRRFAPVAVLAASAIAQQLA